MGLFIKIACVCAAFFLIAADVVADPAQGGVTHYTSIANDLPVPIGAHELTERAYVFETDNGQIAETALLLDTISITGAIDAYALLLPPLGWEAASPERTRYQRQGTRLTLIPDAQEPNRATQKPVLRLRLTMP